MDSLHLTKNCQWNESWSVKSGSFTLALLLPKNQGHLGRAVKSLFHTCIPKPFFTKWEQSMGLDWKPTYQLTNASVHPTNVTQLCERWEMNALVREFSHLYSSIPQPFFTKWEQKYGKLSYQLTNVTFRNVSFQKCRYESYRDSYRTRSAQAFSSHPATWVSLVSMG